MVCHYCGATISDRARFCGKCGKPQNIVVNLSSTPVFASSELSSALPSLPPGAIRLPLAEQEAKQQELLSHLHREMDTKFMQQSAELARQQEEFDNRLKALEPEKQLKEGLSRIVTVIILIVLTVAGVGFTWFLYTVVNYRSATQSDAITIIGTALTITGILYLGYDLLGRQHGPLLWLTLFATGGLAGVSILEPITLPIALTDSVPLALEIALTGALLGAFSALLFGAPDRGTEQHRFSLKMCLLGVALGEAFWIMFLSIFLPNYSGKEVLGLLLLATLLAVPTGGILGGFHPFINYEAPTSRSRPSFFSWKSSLKGFAIGLFVWGLLVIGAHMFAPGSDSNTPILDIIAVLILASAGAASGGIARFTFWWVNHLPERVLGAFGLIVTFIGAILPAMQPLLNILKAIGKL